MVSIIYDVQWTGERAAGINPGSEVVTIKMDYSEPEHIDADAVEYFRQAIAEYFDGSYVQFVRMAKS